MNLSNQESSDRPLLAWTLGDVAGVGPELVVKAWSLSEVHALCRPVVIGSADVLCRVAEYLGSSVRIKPISANDIPGITSSSEIMPCFDPTKIPVDHLTLGQVHAAAGQAAHDYLVAGIDLAVTGIVEGIVTLPLHKEGLRAAGLPYPGHTEILAERTGSREYGMMLYRRGLGVLHVTLHMSLRKALDSITGPAIEEKISLLDTMMRQLAVPRPRLAVAALNPHASDGGLFGHEEASIVSPAVERAKERGFDVVGPIPADTLFVRASKGEFDGVVALYHDQGHIALKLLGWREAVNITVGLPIVRTSVAHGTAYDIVGQGKADPTSLLEALRVASLLCRSRRRLRNGELL
jgi:4-hydroxythreonine-4-phosphate dehydrogenase